MDDVPGAPRRVDRPESPDLDATTLANFSEIRESISLAIGGLGEFAAALFPDLERVWKIAPQQANAVGKVWEKKIERDGDPSPQLLRVINSLPTLAAIGTTAIVFIPRISFTLRYFRSRKQRSNSGAVDIFHPTAPPGPEQRDEPPDQVDVAAPIIRPAEGSGLAGGGYQGERDESFRTIDGTDAAE